MYFFYCIYYNRKIKSKIYFRDSVIVQNIIKLWNRREYIYSGGYIGKSAAIIELSKHLTQAPIHLKHEKENMEKSRKVENWWYLLKRGIISHYMLNHLVIPYHVFFIMKRTVHIVWSLVLHISLTEGEKLSKQYFFLSETKSIWRIWPRRSSRKGVLGDKWKHGDSIYILEEICRWSSIYESLIQYVLCKLHIF